MKRPNKLVLMGITSGFIFAGLCQAAPVQGSTDLTEQLKLIQNEYKNLVDFDAENYVATFEIDPTQMAARLAEAPTCSDATSFKPVSKDVALDALAGQFSKDYLAIGDQDDGYFSAMEAMTSIIYKMSGKIGNQTVEICSDNWTPAYSDGNQLIAVKVGGKLAYVQEAGQPD